MKTSKQFSKIFKALSHPNRLELFLKILRQEQVRQGESSEKSTEKSCFLSTLCQNLKIGAPTISHHLKELVNAELVQTERAGKFILCQVNHQTLHQLRQLLSAEATTGESENHQEKEKI